jgi:uncharacterized protein YjbI with pentapeptide repeats
LANPEHLAKLKEGVEPWNRWRKQNPEIRPDLREADLCEARLREVDLSNADLYGANLSFATLREASLRKADLSTANLNWVNLNEANLYGANLNASNLIEAQLLEAQLGSGLLVGADLTRANLGRADLHGADARGAQFRGASLFGASLTNADLRRTNLVEADLSAATLVETNLEEANLTGCSVYGISAWNLKLERTIQSSLVITPFGESPIQVDNLEVAQFIYLLLNNDKIRSVIETITSKVVLILGRFTPERKKVLDAIRDELRKRDYSPILFDFEPSASKDFTGTIFTLANMARFIIADLTDPSSVPYELGRLVPNTKVPVQTIIMEGQREFAMFVDLKSSYHWVLEPYQYKSQELLITHLSETVIAPAEAKVKELVRK